MSHRFKRISEAGTPKTLSLHISPLGSKQKTPTNLASGVIQVESRFQLFDISKVLAKAHESEENSFHGIEGVYRLL